MNYFVVVFEFLVSSIIYNIFPILLTQVTTVLKAVLR